MTGRATIGGKTRKAIIWEALRQQPMTVTETWRQCAIAMRTSYTALDTTMRQMIQDGTLAREVVARTGAPHGRVYVYTAVGDQPPADGRKDHRTRSEARLKPRHSVPVDDEDDDGDDWPRGRGVSKGNVNDVPALPTLLDLLAR